MKKLLILGIILISLVFISACDDISSVNLKNISEEDVNKIIVCKEPYIRFAASCCLDKNNNKICDNDEFKNNKEQSDTEIIKEDEFEDQEEFTAKLISITGGDFVPSAGYYEGKLILSDITTGKEYPIFACSESWNWVKESSCYKLNPEEVNENVEQHKFSAELSGCYVGSLEEVSC